VFVMKTAATAITNSAKMVLDWLFISNNF